MLALVCTVAVISCDVVVAQPTEITLDARQVLNTHADQVGVWIDSRQERLNPKLIAALKDLKVKSVRYGWQFALFDKNDTRSEEHSPADPKAGVYFTDGRGRMAEKIGPQGVADLLELVDADGFAVVSTDGLNYFGSADAKLAAMSPSERLDFYATRAADWATWARSNRFRHFEIGNENDISGHGEQESIIEPWDPEAYARVARRYVTDIKAANPNAECGINGGLLEAAKVVDWYERIAAAEPSLANDLDFLVAHKYEFWLDYSTWAAHADWAFGSVTNEVLSLRERLFPKLPIHVTEIGSWKTGEIDQHYRALLMTEMLGNVYRHAAVEHVQVWPTRWTTEGGVFGNSDDSELSPMGLGMKAYSAFARPILFANGAAANVRYFASRDEAGGVSVWFVNHSDEPRTLNCNLANLTALSSFERWQLSSPSNDPIANDTELVKRNALSVRTDNNEPAFEVTVPPLSATVLTSR